MNRPATDRGATTQTNIFLDVILQRWESDPSGTFAIYMKAEAESRVSNRDVQDRAFKFLTLMRQHDAVVGDIILLICRHGVDGHAAFLGAMLGGLVPSFLPYPNIKQDSGLYWRQHRTLFEHCGAKLALVYDELVDTVADCAEGTGLQVIPLSAVLAIEPTAAMILPAGDQTALLQHSSGTTGQKKGVALSFNSVAQQLKSYAGAVHFTSCKNAVVATWLPLYHDMGLISSFLLPCWLGIPIVSLDPFAWIAAPVTLLDAIARHRATHVWLPNFALLVLVRSARAGLTWDLSCLRAVISCSEPSKPKSFDAFLSKFNNMGVLPEALQSCYAMAETVFAVSQSDLRQVPRRINVSRQLLAMGTVAKTDLEQDTLTLLSNGPPIEGCLVRIATAGAATPAGRVGEILVRTASMFTSYHSNAEATRAVMEDGWYRTGDLGFIDEDEIFIVGRMKDVIIVNGKNIFAHDVEAAVSVVAGVKPGRCVAFGRFSERIGSEELIVVAERAELVPPDVDETTALAVNQAVISECGVSCADIRLVNTGWLVKTTSGKTSRAENAFKYEAMI